MTSASTTPAGNVLMQLNRETILRNRMGMGGMLPAPPPGLATTGSGTGPDGNQVLAPNQLPQPHNPRMDGREGSVASPLAGNGNVFGVDNCGGSGAFDAQVQLAPVGTSAALGDIIAGAMNSTRTARSISANDCMAVSSASCASGNLSSAVPAFASGANGACSGNPTKPTYGLGVEATLSEMQQMALIGSGGGGCVYIGRWRGVTVAIKFIVSSNDDQLTRSQREALLSRLASHPHVVQTYATSVTQLNEAMFKPKGGMPGDMLPGGMSVSEASISHDLLAGLTSGSWIRTELQTAMNGGGSEAHGAMGAISLPTIFETQQSLTGSGSTSVTTSARGGTPHDSVPRSSSLQQVTGCESDGAMSSPSITAGTRVADAAPASTAGPLPAGQADAPAATTAGANSSCHAGDAKSSVSGSHLHLLQAVLPSMGTKMPGSVPTSGVMSEGPAEGDQAGANSGEGGNRAEGHACGGGVSTAGHLLSEGESTAETTTTEVEAQQPDGAGAAGDGAAEAASATTAGKRVALGGAIGGGADSFDSSFVRAHLGRTKYSIHEVLLQLGAREGQFLTMVIMEYCDGGSLLAALKEGPFHRDTTSWSPRMWLRSTVRTALEIAHGMKHLHLSGLVHGDLKPGNVLLKGSNHDKRKFVAKVSDLGIAHPVGSADEMAIDDGQIGSIAYMAPEVFRGRIMKASDVYSFGVLLWQMACGTGSAPFEGAHPVAIALGVSEGKMTLRWPPGVFRPLQQLGELCLQTDPVARPSFKSVVGALEKLERHIRRLSAAAGAGVGGLRRNKDPGRLGGDFIYMDMCPDEVFLAVEEYDGPSSGSGMLRPQSLESWGGFTFRLRSQDLRPRRWSQQGLHYFQKLTVFQPELGPKAPDGSRHEVAQTLGLKPSSPDEPLLVTLLKAFKSGSSAPATGPSSSSRPADNSSSSRAPPPVHASVATPSPAPAPSSSAAPATASRASAPAASLSRLEPLGKPALGPLPQLGLAMPKQPDPAPPPATGKPQQEPSGADTGYEDDFEDVEDTVDALATGDDDDDLARALGCKTTSGPPSKGKSFGVSQELAGLDAGNSGGLSYSTDFPGGDVRASLSSSQAMLSPISEGTQKIAKLEPLRPIGASKLSPLAPLAPLPSLSTSLSSSKDDPLGTRGPKSLAPLSAPVRKSMVDIEKEKEELRRLGLLQSGDSLTNSIEVEARPRPAGAPSNIYDAEMSVSASMDDGAWGGGGGGSAARDDKLPAFSVSKGISMDLGATGLSASDRSGDIEHMGVDFAETAEWH
ncbi:hypothetical protein VOLCADRAFT_120439 [Volvox carteri f. nagariensis]|uniref:Protein kinase domain-containing protein n=1 Tax=Volvox carteri f. nagariensis TaxID=3068 RepID=D8TLC0_VOLCA|nr:uncharacterized protein VOLCADRAFT_120439 [Volvox carteri f. nagariensis]EFJ51709.1 hypothetical protein VOLCADRAFT_120439 [Volvox carteri f. nagariensis]|eukprot:XP_002947119.1 hypothetical protein VOLCADRAFT_120439 [Volvox carteri f. nagariensis]